MEGEGDISRKPEVDGGFSQGQSVSTAPAFKFLFPLWTRLPFLLSPPFHCHPLGPAGRRDRQTRIKQLLALVEMSRCQTAPYPFFHSPRESIQTLFFPVRVITRPSLGGLTFLPQCCPTFIHTPSFSSLGGISSFPESLLKWSSFFGLFLHNFD